MQKDNPRLGSTALFWVVLLSINALAFKGYGQSMISTPAALNDSIELCSTGNNTVSFSVGGAVVAQSFIWDFPNGSPAFASGQGPHSVSFGPGNSTVRLFVFDNGQPSDTLFRYISVGTPSSASFNPSQTNFCQSGAAVGLSGGSPAGGYYRGPGVSNNIFNPSVAGIGNHNIWYYFANAGCLDSAQSSFTVQGSVNAVLRAQGSPIMHNGKPTYTRCAPAGPLFNFYTTTASGSYTSFTIDFGDGNSQSGSSFPSPYLSYSYANTGLYQVVLSMTDAGGCVSHDTIQVFYGSNPSVGLSIKGNNIKCLPQDSSGITFAFPISNINNNPPGTVYIVEVNDGSPPVTYNHPPPDSILHTFYEPSCGYNTANFQNAFQVRITAKTPCQPNSVATVEPIFISDPPTAAFSVEPRICLGEEAHVIDESWGSVNALTGCDTNVTLVWEILPGNYTVNSGSTGSLMGSSNAMNWIPGTNQMNVTFTKPGIYTVNQYVGNQAGCEVDTVSHLVCVDSIAAPEFAMQSDTFCSADTVEAWFLNPLRSACDTTELIWDISPATGWSFLTGSNDSLIKLYFYQPGDYDISVTSDNICNHGSYTRSVSILAPPQVILPKDRHVCGLEEIDFSKSKYRPATSGGGNSYLWQVTPATGWSFSGGSGPNDEFPSILFSQTGSYQVVLSATNDCGFSSDTVNYSFYPAPQLDAVADTLLCYGSDFQFRFGASGGTAPLRYSWKIVPGGSKVHSDTIILNNLQSNLKIELMVIDSAGCNDIRSFNINVSPQIQLSGGQQVWICREDTAQLNPSVTGGQAPYSYRWINGLGLSDTTILNPYRIPMDSSSSHALLITDALGCSDTAQVMVQVYPRMAVDAGPDRAVCYDSSLVVLNDHSPKGGQWSGSGLTDSIFDPIVAGMGSHLLYYDFTDANGCAYRDSLLINVISLPVADFSLSPAGCGPLQVQAYDSSSAGVNHRWYVNQQLASTLANPTFVLGNSSLTDSIYTIKLVIEAGSGCTDSISKSITVYPGPKAGFSLPSEICPNDSVQISQNSSAGGPLSYQWWASSPFVRISNDTAAAPFLSFGDNQSGTDSSYVITMVATTPNGCSDTVQESIQLNSRPLADFSLPAPACSPQQLNLISSSTGSGLSFQWSVTPAAPIARSNKFNPQIDLPLSSNDTVNYRISLMVTDGRGCIDSISRIYTVYPQPTAAFTPSVSQGCGPLAVSFNNFSSPNISGQGLAGLSFAWDLGNGQFSNDSVPTAIYTNTGLVDSSYLVKLLVSNQYGCQDSITDTIVVHPQPRAVIDSLNTVNCAPFLLDDQAAVAQLFASNQSYLWELVDRNGVVVHRDSGATALNYTMTSAGDSLWGRLIASSAFGCPNDTDWILFRTLPDPVAAFAALPQNGCSPLNVQLQDSSTAGVSHRWYINGVLSSSQANPSFSFVNNDPQQDSVVEILLAVSAGNGCSDSTSKLITIHANPQADFSLPSQLCPEDTAFTSNLSLYPAGSSFQWKVSSPSVTISNDSAAAPWFSFQDNQSGSDSSYQVSLIVSSPNGCVDSIQRTIILNSRPQAGFAMPANSCGPLVLNPIDTSSGPGLSYSWSVSPAIAIQGAANNSPTFSFPQSLSDSVRYTIRLQISDNRGCTDSAIGYYTVYPKPQADFTLSVQDTCGPVMLSVANLSHSGQSGMQRSSMSFVWTLSNGMSSTDSVPSFSLQNNSNYDSTYVLTLVASNAFGCSDTISDSITLRPSPRAVISYSTQSACAPFALDSTVVNAQLLSLRNQNYYWEVIDRQGTIVAQDSGVNQLNYLITQPGDSVWVRLTASSPHQCASDTSLQLFYTLPDPIASFSLLPSSGCSPLTVNVADSSNAPNKSWYVNDSLWYSGNAPAFSFVNNSRTQDSSVVISLVVVSADGCRDSSAQSVLVHPSPLASFSAPAEVCPNEIISLHDSSMAKAGYSLQWSVNSPRVSINQVNSLHPLISFPDNQSGVDSTFLLKLIITTADGCVDSLTQAVLLRSRPVADFNMPAASCAPLTVNPLNAQSGNNLQYQWSVTPAISIQGAQHHTPSFSFPASFNDSVTYQISLVLTDSISGCSDSNTVNYTVYPRPTADFSFNNNHYCGPLTVNFQNLSSPNQSGMDRSSMSFAWDFGNGQTSTDSIPSVTFTNSGLTDSTYLVRLIASNTFGCSDTVYDTVVVHPAPRASFSATTTASCTPFTIDSNVVNVQLLSLANDRYYWEVIDRMGIIVAQDSAVNGLNYTISQPSDSVWVRLTATSRYGCDSDTSLQLFYSLPNPAAAFTPLPAAGCSPLSVSVADSAQPNAGRQWFVNDSLYHNGVNPQLQLLNLSATQDSTVTIKLVVTDANGCVDSSFQQVVIHPAPIADFQITAEACPNAVLYPSDSSQAKAGFSYLWSVNSPMVSISNNSLPNPAFGFPDNQSGYDSTYQVSLKITSPDGCSDSISRTVTIFSRPVADFSMPAASCAPLTVNPINAQSGNNLQYQWSVTPAISIQGAQHHTPSFSFPASFNDSVTYQISLVLTDSISGCSDSSTVNYTVYPRPTAAFSFNNNHYCGPLTVNFQNLSSPNQSGMDRSSMSFAWDFGNGQTSTDSIPSATFTNSGLTDSTYLVQLIASNAFGCSDTVYDTVVVHPAPRASFVASNQQSCTPFLIDSALIQLQAQPFANGGYYWEVIDGQGTILQQDSSLQNLNYLITQPNDSIWVRLTATSRFGCDSDTSLQLFYSLPNPAAAFSPLPAAGCSPLSVSVADSAQPNAGRQWFVNDSLYHIGMNPQFHLLNLSATQDSTVTIKLVVTDANGCMDSSFQQVVIHPAPIADFHIAAEACPAAVLFPSDSSQAKAGYSYLWSVNSSTVSISNSSLASPAFSFPANQSGYDSTYQVSLKITTPDGCSDSISRPVTIFSRPVADFSMPAGACAPLQLGPIDQSSGRRLQYQWQVWPAIPAQNLQSSAPSFNFPLSTNDSVSYQIQLLLTDSLTGCSDTLQRSFSVYPKPTAAFQPTPKDSCGPVSIRFNNLSTANQSGMNRNSMSFSWDFGNGQTSTDSVPTVSFSNSGLVDSVYYVQLIATNAFGCSDTVMDSVRVHPDPRAVFNAQLVDCAPLLIDSSAINYQHYNGANAGYRFQFIDPFTDSVLVSYNRADSINFLLPHPGDSVIFRLVALSPYGCKSDTAESLFYTVGREPIGFSLSASEGCSPLIVSLADTGNGYTAWEWYVNGQLMSQLKNPTLSFTNRSGQQDSVYTVKMIATAGNGCPDSIVQQIRVYAPLSPQFSVANACLGDSLSFSNLTPMADSVAHWHWDFGDGQSDSSFSPLHRYAAAGQYLVTLTATSIHGCVFSISDTAVQYPRPQAAFGINNACGLDSACLNQSVSFHDSSSLPTLGGTIVQWLWDINNDGSIDYTGSNPSHVFSATGTYPVSLIVSSSNGCSDTIVRNIEIYAPPVANFALANLDECGPFVPLVNDSSSGLIRSYYWEVFTKDGNGQRVVLHSSSQANPNPLPSFYSRTATDSTYYIELTVSNCCGSNSLLDSVVMKPKPIAYTNPSHQSGCTPLDVNFQLDGLVKGLPDYLVFDYGDGSPLDTVYRFYQLNPNGDTIWVWGQQPHRFINNGLQDTTFTVALTAVNACGDSTVYTNILVHPNNVQAFIYATPESGCAPLTVTIKDQSFGGNFTSWCLDYDMGSGQCNLPSAVGDSIVHTYTTAGTYVIAQFVNDGCSADTAYKTITVYPSPEADFSHSGDICQGDTVFFSNNSIADTITGYTWNFGDGSSSILKDPQHRYTSGGSFAVSLSIMSSNGCSSIHWDTVRVYGKPEVEFSASSACFNQQPISFFDSSSVSQGQIVSTLWKFGDGNTSVAPNPVHHYANPGMYTVTLIHGSGYGCVDSVRHIVNVFPTPEASFDAQHASSKTCGAPQLYTFQNQSTGAAGYYWDFDYYGQRGQHTSTINNPSHLYLKEGVYTVMLIASNTFGCSDTSFKQVMVRPVPKPGFQADVTEGCAPLTVNFSDTSVYDFNGPGGIVKWIWDFGDGNYAYDSAQVTHTYQDPGVYTVKLYVETDGGCGDSITFKRYIRVLPTPVASFTETKLNAKTIQLNNLTKNVSMGTTYWWDFGDGNTSTDENPVHTYNVDLFENDFQFEICLVTLNEFGCGDTTCLKVDLKGYLLFTPNAFAPDLSGAGEARFFLPKGHSLKEYHLKIFDEWGNIMFESTSLDENGTPDEAWDGTNMQNGTPLPMGGYVWQIDALMNDGTIWEGLDFGGIKKRSYGTVTLLR